VRTCAAWSKFSFWYCWSWNTYACTTAAFWSRGPSSNPVCFVFVWSNPSLLPHHSAVWILQSWLQCATRVSAGYKGIHRLHRIIGCTHRQLPAWSAPVRWRRSADEAHKQQQRRIHHSDSAAMHRGRAQLVLIQTTSAESIENWSYLVWHNTQFEKTESLDLSLRVEMTSISQPRLFVTWCVLLDGELTLKKQISKVANVCYFHLRRLKPIRRILGRQITASLINAFVFKSVGLLLLCVGWTTEKKSTTAPLQRVQNAAVRVICGLGRMIMWHRLYTNCPGFLSNNGWHSNCVLLCFKAFEKIPSRSDAFTISARVPASSGIRRFTSEVGAGSNEQCFAGARLTIFVISSAVVSRNTNRQIHCQLAIIAEDSPEVGVQDCICFGAEVDGKVIGQVWWGCRCLWNLKQRVDFRPESTRVANIGLDGLGPVARVLLIEGKTKDSWLSAPGLTISIRLAADSRSGTASHVPDTGGHSLLRLDNGSGLLLVDLPVYLVCPFHSVLNGLLLVDLPVSNSNSNFSIRLLHWQLSDQSSLYTVGNL